MRRVIAVVGISAALLAACGDKKNDSAAVSSSTTAATTAATTATTSATVTSAGNSVGTGDLTDFCKARDNVNAASSATPASENMRRAFEDGPALIQAAADHAPAEIRNDFKTVAEALIPFFKAMRDANGDFTKIDFTNLQKLQDPKYKDAAKRVADYYAAHCG